MKYKIKALEMSLKWDKKAKEERSRCVRENIIDNISVVVNKVLKIGKEILEKYESEVIKIKDSYDHCMKHMQHKYGEKY